MSLFQPEAIHPENSLQPALPLELPMFIPYSCSACGKGMMLRDARDYGRPDDVPRRVMRVVWWECPCGQREVVTNDILSS